MRILHTAQSYPPEVGGVAEVVRQVSERLVARGHDVTVATSYADRRERCIAGVTIEEFAIHGSLATGITGERDRYEQFLRSGRFDVMMNYAAQQWATDLALRLLPELPYARVLAPCGFSGLRRPIFDSYFSGLPAYLEHYDGLIFHSDVYQDIEYVRGHLSESKITVIPNGCGEDEFIHADGATFRASNGIGKDVPVLLCVGNHTGLKGHDVAIEAFRRARIPRAVLVIAGRNLPSDNAPDTTAAPSGVREHFRAIRATLKNTLKPSAEGPCALRCKREARITSIASFGAKRVLLLDAPRPELVDAFDAADLFIFPSRVECSPIVLFEAIASHTPFLTTDCGNAREIIELSGGAGEVIDGTRDDAGWVHGDAHDLARKMEALLRDHVRRQRMADAGYDAWRTRFTWEKIALAYEDAYRAAITERARAHTPHLNSKFTCADC